MPETSTGMWEGLTRAMDHKPAAPDATSEAPRKNVGSTLSRCSGPAFCSTSCHTMTPVTTYAHLQLRIIFHTQMGLSLRACGRASV